MGGISLTSSMRSNLQSLQAIAGSQSVVQNRLATGLKVSSAIDNASSYYTATSLNNRAADLGSLLDSMSQGIQTIKTATQALQTASDFLEQATAVALEAMEGAPIKLDKSWFVEEAKKQNGVVVSNAQELDAAIASNQKLIVVYDTINYSNKGISLKPNQNIVGTEYFANINKNALYRDDKATYSSTLKFANTDGVDRIGITVDNNSIISDLHISLINDISANKGALYVKGNNVLVKNVDVRHSAKTGQACAIHLSTAASAALTGNINAKAYTAGSAIPIYNQKGNLTIKDANLTSNQGILTSSGVITNIIGKTTLNLNAPLAANVAMEGGNTINIGSEVTIFANPSNIFNIPLSSTINPNSGLKENILNIASGAKIVWNLSNNKKNIIQLTKNTSISSLLDAKNITKDNLKTELGIGNYQETQVVYISPSLPNSVAYDSFGATKQYNAILGQLDDLVKDSKYKGVNLLLEQNLKIRFNESNTSKVEIRGVDASKKGLGLEEAKWENQNDISKSIDEIKNALNKIRSYQEEFGNYYSIVSTREDFTNAIINVLSEGGDKLTLADMNQESANMLALQTRQQLAVNALSLASQAAQSVLKLF